MKQLIRNIQTKLLSDNWYKLNKLTYEFLRKNGTWEIQHREVYDRGNGICILLYNLEKKTVLLTKQFRMPTFLNGNKDGLLIEVCAGVLEAESPEEGIIREVEEELGHKITQLEKVFEVYMSPGAVTEILHFYLAPYSQETQIHSGGGLDHEQEDIEVLEIPFQEAIQMMHDGRIRDAKTIMLLQHAQIKNLFT